MKRIALFLMAFSLMILFAAPVYASDSKKYVVDAANLLSESETAELSNRLEEISNRQKLDIVVVTTDTLYDYSPMEFADDFFDYNNYGYGDTRDGILLLVSMEQRDYWLSTSGNGIYIFTDAGIDYIGEQIVPSLSRGDYADAFNIYADQCDKFAEHIKTSAPYDRESLPRKSLSVKWIFYAIIIGFVFAMISICVMASKLKSVRIQRGAANYIKSGSMNITESRDLFLYRNIHRVRRPENNSRSRGSSTHRSSSGRSHGGGGGKF